jgi:hypothetical protein
VSNEQLSLYLSFFKAHIFQGSLARLYS